MLALTAFGEKIMFLRHDRSPRPLPVFFPSLAFGFLCLGTASLSAQRPVQTANADPRDGQPIFRTGVQTVVVDVVVTDKYGNHQKGLHQEDFELKEEGRPQKVTSFEEHGGAPITPPPPSSPLRPGVFTNESFAPASDVVNVLLLDSLNTAITDQSYVHSQAAKYLKNLPPGTRMAIFTLSSELRFVLGFTSDASELS